MLIIDAMVFERNLYKQGSRSPMLDAKTNTERQPGSTCSLENVVRSFASKDGIVLPNVKFHNAGNDAFMCLFALQMLIDPAGVKAPTVKRFTPISGTMPMTKTPMPPALMIPYTFHSGYATVGGLPTPTSGQRISSYDLSSEFGQMRMGVMSVEKIPMQPSRSKSPGPRLMPGSGNVQSSRKFRLGD